VTDPTNHIDPGDPPPPYTGPLDDGQPDPPDEQPANLPAPFADSSGQLDADALRALAPILRRDLIAALRNSTTAVRDARGTVVVPEDTYDLVRRLTSAGESLRSVAEAFTAAAKEADAIIEEEALAVSGAELDGVLLASLFVPDGVGQRIAVRADRESSSSVWDVSTLIGWLIDDEVDNLNGERRQEQRRVAEQRQAAADPNAEGVEPGPRDPVEVAAELAYYEVDVRSVAHEVVARLLQLGRYTPGAKPVEALRKRLAEQQRDADAAVIRQVRTVTPGRYKGVTITREEAK
jgi:hypothetical protein